MLVSIVACFLASSALTDDSVLSLLEKLEPQVDKAFTVPIPAWRFARPDFAGGERPDLDDSSWQVVAPGFSWQGEDTNVWFRTRLTVPTIVANQSVAGHSVRLQLGVDDDGELYIGGQLREAFRWDDCLYTLTPQAKGGEIYDIAIRGMNGPGDGQLRSANLVIDVLPELRRYVTEARFTEQLQSNVPADEQPEVTRALVASMNDINPGDCSIDRIDRLRGELSAATAHLARISSITKAADVYYVGHAHIDMNWLWTWPETIDVCHRTWNSAMNLMDEFPDFGFDQSQPGAYVPIQQQYPDEFKRMQAAQARGQWDLVGGLWNESDTDLPSGEGLARSLLLGQRFFKKNFGTYAKTAWLPDSFGHSWQMQQLYALAGMDSFYHMRGGDGIPFSWWEGPDGSRVLKANTIPYNADVDPGQLLEPWNESRRTGMPQTLVVYGVGDHGGGPTREQALKLEQFKNDPVLPNVHVGTIDEYFKDLSARAGTRSLPIIDHDLQYVNVGCYTTHADLKKALRTSENRLYSAEALSSLAAMDGSPYPSNAFESSWAVTAFAQFHDIACGSAIHSTYQWMEDQLDPAIKTSEGQTATAIKALSAEVDTRGPTNEPIVVWNALSFQRDDVVRVAVPNASSYHSVVDQTGHRFAAQADLEGDLVFIARDVPGFGHQVYFPSKAAGSSDHLSMARTGNDIRVETPKLAVRIDGATGTLSELRYKPDDWNVFGKSDEGNTFQVLGDSANAWDITYTGESHQLSDPGADVAVVESGPVFARIKVVRGFRASRFRQDIVIYGALDRIDVPTDIDWHEHGQLVKVCLPVQAAHGVARVQIPYGSIQRPTNAQECPGQKWMDYSDEVVNPVRGAQPLDLLTLLNSDSRQNFDGGGYGYPPDLLPAAGITNLGAEQIPFDMRTGVTGGHDNVACQGQTVPVPTGGKADTVYLLCASAPDRTAGGIRLRFADGSAQTMALEVNDWCAGGFDNSEPAMEFPYRYKSASDHGSGQPHLWIASVKVPSGELQSIQLPNEPRMHIFAATLANAVPNLPIHGLSVLNDCKYGFDVKDDLFRLTVLRSSADPDKNPDEGRQLFTYSLYPHAKGWRDAHCEQQGLALNVPLEACLAMSHAAAKSVPIVTVKTADDNVIAGALKHAEDGDGYILRLYETQGCDSQVQASFDRPIAVEETDLLERPLKRRNLSISGRQVTFPIGHDQIVTLHVVFPH